MRDGFQHAPRVRPLRTTMNAIAIERTGHESREQHDERGFGRERNPRRATHLYLAGGCFWGLEAYLKRLPGVRGTVVGYANGSTENPSYHDVCRWNTGHAETVAVTYDPRVLPTDVLLDAFLRAIDPRRSTVRETTAAPSTARASIGPTRPT